MGASRKLQGEIDRVLKKVQEGVDIFDSIWNKVYDTENANQKEKFEADLKKEIKKLQRYRDQIKSWIQSSEIKDKKVSASYEQALMDARKQIEREMERFKVCEKETKTKAFSKEGLGQQPKTDPKEKAKSETRDWLNTVVGDLESQIDNFEAEIEGLSVKKGKTKPNRLTHLETSITRHKTHIMKLEWILRLLDNDELSTEQVNDVKEFLEDYVERNQEDFDDFSDPDELYSALPLDKVESLEDFVAIGTSGLVKGVGSVSTSAVLGMKGSITSAPSQLPVAVASVVQQSASSQEQAEETASQDSNSEIVPRTPPSKSALVGSVSAASLSISSNAQPGSNSVAATGIASARSLTGGSTAAAILSGPSPILGVIENPASGAPSSVSNISSSAKEDDNISFLGRRSSPAPIEIGLGRGIVRGPMVGGLINQGSTSVSMPLGSIGGVSTSAALGAVPAVSDVAKRNILGADERVGAGLSQPLVSPLSSRMVSQVSRANDGSTDSNNVAEGPVIGRVFSPSVVSGVQWRPQTVTAFQNQNETFRGRTEIAPDQREKFLQRLQQVQQQGPSNLLNVPHLPGGHKQFPTQQQNSLLQQLNSQTSNLPSQVGIGLGIQTPGLATISPTSQQPISMNQQSSQHALLSAGSKDADVGHMKIDEQLQQQNLSDDLNAESALSSGLKQNIANEDDLKSPYMSAGATSTAEVNQVPRDIDLSPGQPLQLTQSSASLGVIGRRSVPDLGAIVDNISIANPGVVHDHAYNLQMLEAAYFKLPQPKDSERVKNYIPRKPAVTPASYPQMQAPVVDNPAFWDRLGIENMTDILFFAFYYQQNTYQQYLAAKELKKQSWRYHRKYNTWFQRHEEPKVTNDDFEQGTYVYFDFNITEDNHGWCQRIKTEFTFEYTYLEDELV